MLKIYVLRLEGGNWYVGKTPRSVSVRFKEHVNGKGSAWTRLHKPIKIERVLDNASSFDEDKITKEYMGKYGIDKVRGGSYVQPELEDVQIYTAQREIWAANNCCTNCGRSNHFVSKCYAKTDVNGEEIYEDSSSDLDDDDSSRESYSSDVDSDDESDD